MTKFWWPCGYPFSLLRVVPHKKYETKLIFFFKIRYIWTGFTFVVNIFYHHLCSFSIIINSAATLDLGLQYTCPPQCLSNTMSYHSECFSKPLTADKMFTDQKFPISRTFSVGWISKFSNFELKYPKIIENSIFLQNLKASTFCTSFFGVLKSCFTGWTNGFCLQWSIRIEAKFWCSADLFWIN